MKREENTPTMNNGALSQAADKKKRDDYEDELDAAQLGLKETYHQFWAVCKLPAFRCIFFILMAYTASQFQFQHID